ncbi:MAG: hypothetical protein ACYTX0_30830 [Nostoc sp.]
MTQQLEHLLDQAHALLEQVSDHPDYHSLLEQGFAPENTVFGYSK